MKRLIFAFASMLLLASSLPGSAQVVASATGRRLSVTAGVLGSAFQPDYAGNFVPATSPNRLYGVGTYVDVKFSRWIQVEGEGRWLRFNEFAGINEDNYLIGPRIPIHRFGRFTPYAKALVGYGTMTFENNIASGHFTDLAFGGGTDYKLTKRFSVRGDFEYQEWPRWVNSSLYPYGASVGVGYKIF
jgi:opacity protein-like surface antigen